MYREAALVPDAAIALDFDQALDVHTDRTSQVALDCVFLVNGLAQVVDLFFSEVSHASIGIYAIFCHYLFRAGGPDAKDISQRNFHSLVARNVYACDSSHYCLPLSKF